MPALLMMLSGARWHDNTVLLHYERGRAQYRIYDCIQASGLDYAEEYIVLREQCARLAHVTYRPKCLLSAEASCLLRQYSVQAYPEMRDYLL